MRPSKLSPKTPEKALDAEVAKIADRRRRTSCDPSTAGDVPGVTSGDAHREERVEV
jgi:hypothetical protein